MHALTEVSIRRSMVNCSRSEELQALAVAERAEGLRRRLAAFSTDVLRR